MKQYTTTGQEIRQMAAELLQQGWTVISDTCKGIKFAPVTSADEVLLQSGLKPVNLSLKEYFFPKTEPIFYYKKTHEGVELIDVPETEKKTVIFGAKPCDAASIPVLSKVFNWDYKDNFFNKRVESTVMIGLKCTYADEECFCTSVGLDQSAHQGSDVFMTELKGGDYLVEFVTEKGEKFFQPFMKMLKEVSGTAPEATEGKIPQKQFEAGKVKEWLDKNFDSAYWNELGELCLGCAQCAFVCPTCHCFDIVDEDVDYSTGRRVKNWDACQFCLFTKHASGHNPRDNQQNRYRQRINHKFKYYPDRFDSILCTGCGRCSRGCGVSKSISEVLSEIEKF